MNQLINQSNSIQELNNTLQAIKPDNSPTTQLITYALIATAIVGIMVYHYIKKQEQLC